jgi:hypothetical protein
MTQHVDLRHSHIRLIGTFAMSSTSPSPCPLPSREGVSETLSPRIKSGAGSGGRGQEEGDSLG